MYNEFTSDWSLFPCNTCQKLDQETSILTHVIYLRCVFVYLLSLNIFERLLIDTNIHKFFLNTSQCVNCKLCKNSLCVKWS